MKSALAAAGLMVLTLAGPASAQDPEIDPGTGQSGFLIGGSDENAGGGETPPVGTSPPDSPAGEPGVYYTQPVCELGGSAVCGVPQTCPDGSPMLEIIFDPYNGLPVSQGYNCGGDQPDDTLEAPVLTPDIVLRAFRRIPMPESELNIQPPNGRTLVNFDTNFYTVEQDLDETVTLLGQQVDLRIWADSWTWRFGDGETLTTGKTGAPYPRLQLTHRYLEAERVEVSLDTVYAADYRVNGGPWAPVPGTVSIDGTPKSLQVVEADPQLVGG